MAVARTAGEKTPGGVMSTQAEAEQVISQTTGLASIGLFCMTTTVMIEEERAERPGSSRRKFGAMMVSRRSRKRRPTLAVTRLGSWSPTQGQRLRHRQKELLKVSNLDDR